MSEKTTEKKKELKFEEAMARLEQIVRSLEGGNVALEDLMKLFDEGSELVRYCTAKLDSAEKKVVLLKAGDGELTEEDFDAK